MLARRLTIASGLALSASFAAAQCTNTTWSPQFSAPNAGLAGYGYCLAVFDPDSPGPSPPELYVGGSFTSAGGVPGTRGIARWNGQSWASVGGGITGIGNPNIGMLKVFDPDESGPLPPVLVAVGNFTSVGGVAVQRAATWNGVAWAPMGHEIESTYIPTELSEYDPDGPGPLPRVLLFGDWSVTIGGEYVSMVQWNGTAWSTFLAGNGVHALAVYDEDGPAPANPALFIGVNSSPGLYRWDGTQLSVVGGGLSRSAWHMCCALRVVDEDGPGPGRPVLLAGGTFTSAGGSPALAIARWDGTLWSAMGAGIGPPGVQVEDIIAVDYTGGIGRPAIFAFALDISSAGLMRWNPDGQQWTSSGAFGTQAFGTQHRVAEFAGSGPGTSIYAVGPFYSVDQMASPGIARMSCDCTPNCDHSTSNPLLTANDFQCFLNRFAAGHPYANCDGSTTLPTLTANDFQCYLNQYAAGCP